MSLWPETPGAYGYASTRSHREQVEAEIARQAEQRARRNTARPTRQETR